MSDNLILETIFNHTPVGIATIDREDKFLNFNRAFARMLGYRKKELLKMSFSDISLPQDTGISRKMEELWSGKISRLKREKKYIRKDGLLIFVALHASVVFNPEGEAQYCILQFEDISDRKRTEARIQGLARLKEELFIAGSIDEKARRITAGLVDIFQTQHARLWLMRPGDLCQKGCVHNLPDSGTHLCTHHKKCLHLIVDASPSGDLDEQAFNRIPLNCYKFVDILSGKSSGSSAQDLNRSTCLVDQKLAKKLGLISSLNYRLLSTEGKLLGMLSVQSNNPISPEDEGLLQTIAGTASHAIQSAIKDEELKQHKLNLEQVIKDRTLALQSSEERLAYALEGSNDGIWDFMPQDGEIFYSPRWFTMLGYQANEFPHTYQTWLELLHPDDLAQSKAIVTDFLENKKEVYESHFRMRTAAGNWCWIRSRGKTVVRDQDGNVNRMVGVHTDITDRKQIEEQYRILVAELERANKEINEFAYIVSHDLKAPLRGISSLANWIMEDYWEKLDQKGRTHLKKMLNRTKRMHNLIEDILQYSRVDKNGSVPQKLNTRQLVTNVIESIYVPDTITVTIKGQLPGVTYDKTLLIQVFQNLIINAVKHMGKPEGQITISCNQHDGFFEFCVGDNGVGIEERHFNRIFRLFQSLKPREDSDSTGIGLSLVKKILERNGGTIRVESTAGEGSSFYFTLPKEVTPHSVELLTTFTILIIDDNKEFIEVSEAMLELDGHKIISAKNGKAACQLLEIFPQEVHIALMDVHIPGEKVMERFHNLRRIRPRMKIIACTGKDLSETIDALKEEGIHGVIKKPFKTNQLNKIIQDIFDKKES